MGYKIRTDEENKTYIDLSASEIPVMISVDKEGHGRLYLDFLDRFQDYELIFHDAFYSFENGKLLLDTIKNLLAYYSIEQVIALLHEEYRNAVEQGKKL